MRKTEYLYIRDKTYSRESLLIELESLYWLQRESIKLGTTPSELINKFIKERDCQ